MKKIIASVGLVAVGAVTLSAQERERVTSMEASKPWSVSASLRGFYDDNYNTAPDHALVENGQTLIAEKKDSFGFEVSPKARYVIRTDQTVADLAAIYSMRYYDARKSDNIDHSFEGAVGVTQNLGSRVKLRVDDSLVYTQEPQIVEGTVTAPIVRRIKGDVLRNRGAIEVDAKVSDVASVVGAYNNTFYDYREQINATLLDRLDHRFVIDGRWKLQETLVALAGYNYRIMDYTSDREIIEGLNIRGKDRSSTSHYFYLGAEKGLSSQFNGSAKVGASYTSFDFRDKSTWSPYADANLTYTYLPKSYIQGGIRHDRNATDLFAVTSLDNVTVDAEYTTLYLQLKHQITEPLSASIMGQYQLNEFNGGVSKDISDDLYLLGVNLEYKFSEHWSSEVGYNFDKLVSDVSFRGFTRNRVYIGVTASY